MNKKLKDAEILPTVKHAFDMRKITKSRLSTEKTEAMMPAFIKIKQDKPSYPALFKEPPSPFREMLEKNTKTDVLKWLLANGYGDLREIVELTGYNRGVAGTIIKRLAPVYYLPTKECRTFARPRLLRPKFKYHSTELAIIPMRVNSLVFVQSEKYFAPFMIECAKQLDMTFAGVSTPTHEAVNKEHTKDSLWVKFVADNKPDMYLELHKINGFLESFASICGWFYNGKYHFCPTLYQLPPLWAHIKINTGQKKLVDRNSFLDEIRTEVAKDVKFALNILLSDDGLAERRTDISGNTKSVVVEKIGENYVGHTWEVSHADTDGYYVILEYPIATIARILHEYSELLQTDVVSEDSNLIKAINQLNTHNNKE